ncbi:LysR family transcriptional regulator [Photobacterium salinisoli]|uniref:LysR family transcriptional regulator n=1 Tax=Photobacterium salinisoli TaxID=1616783 RepID=UPI000EA2BF87|nr:LysR family transcriptional regulator [Photobacterium salinisoli]
MNLIQLDMNLLKVLYVLLQTGSTGLTARRLAITPSAVSHALGRLREALNDPLFRREGNQQIPTPFACMLKEKLVPLFVSLNEELFGEDENEKRTFRVVIPPAINALLTPVLAGKGNDYQAQVQCIPFERRAWRDDLLEDKVDLVIAVGDYQKMISALQYELVGKTRLVAFFGNPLREQLKERDSLSMAELSRFRHCYCHPWPQEINELDRQMMRDGEFRNLAFICNDYGQLAPAVRTAPIMAIVPEPWFTNLADKEGLFILPLEGDKVEGGVFMQYRRSTVAWKMRFIDAIRRKLKEYYV